MNKKGQLGFLKVIAVGFMFILLFALALAPMVNTMLGVANLSEFGNFGAWVIGSLNVWFILAFFLVIISALLIGISSGGSSE
jgi:hypothetical protein